LVIEDIRAELRGRPYDLVAVAGGWHLRTGEQFADAIHLAMGAVPPAAVVHRDPSSTVRFTKILSIHGNLSRRDALALHFWGKR
jgi:hypothetical protein